MSKIVIANKFMKKRRSQMPPFFIHFFTTFLRYSWMSNAVTL